MENDSLDTLERLRKQLTELINQDDYPFKNPPTEPPKDFALPKIPMASLLFSLIAPILILILPEIFKSPSISWEIRIIIALSLTCISLLTLLVSSHLQAYKTSYRIQLTEHKLYSSEFYLYKINDLKVKLDRCLVVLEKQVEIHKKLATKLAETKSKSREQEASEDTAK